MTEGPFPERVPVTKQSESVVERAHRGCVERMVVVEERLGLSVGGRRLVDRIRELSR